jgi:excisionase family DNA binding protein
MTSEFLSLLDVADRLGVDRQTVNRWVKQGRLRAYKPGKEYRVSETDLREFLNTREVRPKAEASPEERRTYVVADAVVEAAGEWLKTVTDPDVPQERRFAFRDAAISLFDLINKRGYEEWLEADHSRRADMFEEMADAIGELNKIPQASYDTDPQGTREEAVERRRKQWIAWTRRIAAS